MRNCLQSKIKFRETNKGLTWPVFEEADEVVSENSMAVQLNPDWLQTHLRNLSDLYKEEYELSEMDFQNKFINILPGNWTVCSMTVDQLNNILYVTQMKANQNPLMIKIPLQRSKHSQLEQASMTYGNVLQEFREIIAQNDITIQQGVGCKDAKRTQDWWNDRELLDNRLKKLLSDIESQWFCGFKGILSGGVYEFKEGSTKFQKGFNDLIQRYANEGTTTKKRIEFNSQFCQMVLRLGRYPKSREVTDIIYFALSCYLSSIEGIAEESQGFKTLINQVKGLITQYHDKAYTAGLDGTKTMPNEHVILILDNHLQMLPIESMPILRSQSVSRLPCLSFLRDRILYTQAFNNKEAYADFKISSSDHWEDLKVSKNSNFYVLNPSGDLELTQQMFESAFKSYPSWEGIVRQQPMELQVRSALQTKDIYM
ncbi:peptidase family C50-domain-containing protein [Pilobolus umbonatus]|nr:peptidase family C50-domain-containing protein [Pilobolus umbonatus]